MPPARAGRRRAGFPAAAPESVGLHPEPLRRLRLAIRRNVTELKALPGCAHIILKDGKCVFAHAEGFSDIGRRIKFSLDTMCPLHGATKPLVAAAFLTLVDEGKVRLSDPIDKYIRFPDRAASKGGKGAVRKVSTKPTLRHLLTMTAGVGYDDCPTYRKAMRAIAKKDITDLGGMCEAIADAPLQFQPGTRYHYSFSSDLVGRVCESVSGERIDAFIAKRLLRPLGMKNTYFQQVVPASKRRRQVVMYTSERSGPRRFRLKAYKAKVSAPGIMSCGGGVLSYSDYGMMSCARDYARFCAMLLGGGRAPGSRRQVLREGTVRLLWRDGLTPFQRPSGRIRGWNDGSWFWDHQGWSLLNTHLIFDSEPRRASARKGHTMWMGGGGGAFWSADARRRMAVISFAPIFGGRGSEDDGLGPLANDASPFAAAAAEEGKALPPPRKRRRTEA